jgi:hypothetical protein
MKPALTLGQLKQEMISQEAERTRIVNRGRLAYRMGLELRNNPEKVLSSQKLWDTGWEKEREIFQQMLDRWKRNG